MKNYDAFVPVHRSGWFPPGVCLAPGQEGAYRAFEAAWLAKIKPQGLVELELFHDFMRAQWRKRQTPAGQRAPGAVRDHLRELRAMRKERALGPATSLESPSRSESRLSRA